mmetsp:Transcript_19356/g.40306  ORF Transcript_19356/g.40306 Transcript_19356/m.40306 type:complete len:304 (-) Transcript_19356:107-1018(-)
MQHCSAAGGSGCRAPVEGAWALAALMQCTAASTPSSTSASMSSQRPTTADCTAARSQGQRSGSLRALCRRNSPTQSSTRFLTGAETSRSCSLARSFFSAHQASRSGPARDTDRVSRVVCLRRVRRTAAAAPLANDRDRLDAAAEISVDTLALASQSPSALLSSSSGMMLESGSVRVSLSVASRTVYRLLLASCTTVAVRQFSSGNLMLHRRTCSPVCSSFALLSPPQPSHVRYSHRPHSWTKAPSATSSPHWAHLHSLCAWQPASAWPAGQEMRAPARKTEGASRTAPPDGRLLNDCRAACPR